MERRSHSFRSWRVLVLSAVLVACVIPGWAEVYVLTTGDRITGKKTGERQGSILVKTPYGALSLPRGRIWKIIRDDGREEVINTPPEPPPPPPPPLRLVLAITGRSFWYAWPQDAAGDPTLRFRVRLDGVTVATYTDAKADPGEIKGAVVNAFAFTPDQITYSGPDDVRVQPPETRPGRIVLRVELPAEKAGRRHLQVAYQDAAGTDEASDLVSASLEVEIRAESPTTVQIQQEAGKMEFSGRKPPRMKNVETFKLLARSE